MANRVSWDEYFMSIAMVTAQRSPDLRKVGAVLVHEPTKRILSTGYNGLPSGVSETSIDWINRLSVYNHIIHAEANCLLYANQEKSNSVLYSTKSPCRNCMILIAASRIRKVFFYEPYRDCDSVVAFAVGCGIHVNRLKTPYLDSLVDVLPLERKPDDQET